MPTTSSRLLALLSLLQSRRDWTGDVLADRLEESADPAVRRAAPKLMGAISRAVNLCETTLAFGKAEEQVDTLGGLVLELKQDLPRKGDLVTAGEWSFRVTSLEKFRITEVQVIPPPADDTTSGTV